VNVSDSTRSDELQPLTMTTNWPRPNVCVVHLAGELDIATAPLLADYLREQTAASPAYLLLDLAAVKFLAAAGVTLIVNALRNTHGIQGQLHLVGVTANPSVERVLDLTAVRAVLPNHHSVEHALHHIDEVGRN
jgi:anti-anti-sigma factor